jgi:hypothetical protein
LGSMVEKKMQPFGCIHAFWGLPIPCAALPAGRACR